MSTSKEILSFNEDKDIMSMRLLTRGAAYEGGGDSNTTRYDEKGFVARTRNVVVLVGNTQEYIMIVL